MAVWEIWGNMRKHPRSLCARFVAAMSVSAILVAALLAMSQPMANAESSEPKASREGETCGETQLNDGDRKTLMEATVLIHREKGDTNQPSPAWKAFQKYKKFGASAKDEIITLIAKAAPAGRLYGVILLKEFDAKGASKELDKMKADKTAVMYFHGCSGETSTVGALAQRIANGEELVKLK